MDAGREERLATQSAESLPAPSLASALPHPAAPAPGPEWVDLPGCSAVSQQTLRALLFAGNPELDPGTMKSTVGQPSSGSN